ncbi:hypothetical protein BVG19_g3937 [[Candida] boidinii]|nr:hypothetical protein BVG19_g3937 [[Candida] boidinii]OWB51552.1 hypothetical protein B5S27_g3116 [[Candida] boidinii]
MDYYLSIRPKSRHLYNNHRSSVDIKDVSASEYIISQRLSKKRQSLVNKLRNRLFDYEPGASAIAETFHSSSHSSSESSDSTPNPVHANTDNKNRRFSPMKDISNLKSIKSQKAEKIINSPQPKQLDSFKDTYKIHTDINDSLSKITVNKIATSPQKLYNRFNNTADNNKQDIINEGIKKLFEKVKYELNTNSNEDKHTNNYSATINKLKKFIENQELIIKNLNENQKNLINKIKLIEKNNENNLKSLKDENFELNDLNHNKLLKINNYRKKIELLINLTNNLLNEFKGLKFENKKLINNLNSIDLNRNYNDIDLKIDLGDFSSLINSKDNKDEDNLDTINLLSLNLQNYKSLQDLDQDSTELDDFLIKIENFEKGLSNNKFNDHSNDIDTRLELYSDFINVLENKEEGKSDNSGIITDNRFYDMNKQYEKEEDNSIDLIKDDNDSTYDLLSSSFKEFNIQLDIYMEDGKDGKEYENLSKYNINLDDDYDDDVENTQDLLSF